MNLYGGEYYDGRTYITYQGDDDDIYVRYYDHVKNHWSAEVFAATNPTINGGAHGEGTLCIDALGYIHIIYSGFNNINGYDTFLHAKSKFIKEIQNGYTKMLPELLKEVYFMAYMLSYLNYPQADCFASLKGEVMLIQHNGGIR